jgi:uncharacterized Zn-finger protein
MSYIYNFYRGCEECGRSVDIDDQKCPKCGFDFTLHPRVKPKCPYCEKELHLTDFYVMELDKKGHKRVRGFLGEHRGANQMFHCPFCGKILGFSNAHSG